MSLSHRLLAIALGAASCGPAFAAEGVDPAAADDPFADFDQGKFLHDAGELRWGGYGELHYNNPTSDDPAKLDLHRLVFLAEYTFNDRMKFFTEIEIEHAFVQDGQGELEVEQAYIDFSLHDQASVKAGMLLVPISIMNLYHEPPLFHGVERPTTQKYIVPTTWFEPGVAVHGDISDELSYEVAIQAGLDGSGISSGGVRGARQKGYESKAEDLMVTARTDWRPMPELWLAAAINTGNTAQSTDDDAIDGNVTLYTLEGRYQWQDLSLGLSWSQGFIGDAEELSAANGTTVSESIYGLEVFAAYDLGTLIGTEQTIEPFVRFEIFDTQADVPEGLTEDESQTGNVVTIGVTWKPIPNIAIKGDFQDFENEAENDDNLFNLGIGWMF